MTLTLELSPQTETRLRAIAQEKGVTLEAVALKRLAVSLLSEDELEALEDELDVAAARRAREEDDPADYQTLDDLRAALNRQIAA